jgi:lipoprotein-anchoring transpeptidase ErfK/SrfK
MEDPWLILAAVASPKASLQYIQRALKINPESARARRGMQWAMERLREPEPEPAAAETQRGVVSRLPQAPAQAAPAYASPAPQVPQPKSRLRLPVLLVGIGLFVCALAAVSAAMSPAVAALVKQQVQPTSPPSWALVTLEKPTFAPETPMAFDVQPTAGMEEVSPTPETEVPTAAPTDAIGQDQPTPTLVGQPGETPDVPTAEPTYSGSLGMEYVNDTPTAPGAPDPGTYAGSGEHWIDVNLSQQAVYAYAGDQVVNSFIVSTGTWLHPTVTGKYHVYVKLRYTDMSGADYYLPNVPYTMYFYQGYALHGTYWHHNFGTPMSHGCVNLSIPDAQWLYNFATVGTLVNVHY